MSHASNGTAIGRPTNITYLTNCHKLWLNVCPFVFHLPAKLLPQNTIPSTLWMQQKRWWCVQASETSSTLCAIAFGQKKNGIRVSDRQEGKITRRTLCDSVFVSGQRQSSSWLTFAIAEFVGHCVLLSVSEMRNQQNENTCAQGHATTIHRERK